MKLTQKEIDTIQKTLEKGSRVELIYRTDKPLLILEVKRTEAK